MVGIDRPGSPNDAHVFEMKVGATLPAIEAELLDTAGNSINLNGATVRFVMWAPGSSSNVVDDSASITDPDNGIVVYQWSDGDTDTANVYNAEFRVDYDGGTGNSFDAGEYFPSDDHLDIVIDHSGP